MCSSSIFDYLVLCLSSSRPAYPSLPCFPGIEPMSDRCVCFGLLFTSDDDLGRTFILPYGTFSSADASYLLMTINGLLHVGLKPSIYGRAARLWTECKQPGDCLSHSPFQPMYVRAAAEGSLQWGKQTYYRPAKDSIINEFIN